jgi:hypothetical protein
MLTLVLISDLATAERLPQALTTNFAKVSRRPLVDLTGQTIDRLVVEEEEQWLAIRRCDEIRDEYDEFETDVIRSHFTAPCFVVVEGRGLGLANRMFREVDGALNFLVDNDHGLLCPVEDIKRRIDEGKGWVYEPE